MTASSQSGCGSPLQPGEGDPAAQRLEEAGVAGQQRGVVRRCRPGAAPSRSRRRAAASAVTRSRPRRTAGHSSVDQRLVAGDQPAVPGADGEVAGVVALRGRRATPRRRGTPTPRTRRAAAGRPASGRRRAARSCSPPTSRAIAASTESHGSSCPPRNHGQRAVGVLLGGDPGDGRRAPGPRSGPRAAPAGQPAGQRAAAVRSRSAGPPPPAPAAGATAGLVGVDDEALAEQRVQQPLGGAGEPRPLRQVPDQQPVVGADERRCPCPRRPRT